MLFVVYKMLAKRVLVVCNLFLITRVAVDADACYFGVALVNRIDKIIGLFRTRALYKRLCSAKEIMFCKRDYVLQKRPVILRSLPTVATPCQ